MFVSVLSDAKVQKNGQNHRIAHLFYHTFTFFHCFFPVNVKVEARKSPLVFEHFVLTTHLALLLNIRHKAIDYWWIVGNPAR